MYFCLPNITNPLYIQQLRETVPPPSQNTVGICNQITLLILYYISSRLVTLFEVTDAPTQVSDIFDLTVGFKLINFSLRMYFCLFLKCLLTSRLTFCRLSTLFWFGSCTHCISAPLPLIRKSSTFFTKPSFMLLHFIQTDTLFS